MFCHRSRQETQKYHLSQSTMLWVQRRLHLSLVSIHYQGETICWQGEADFFKVLVELDLDNNKVQALSQLAQNIYLKHPLMLLKHLSVSYNNRTQNWLMEQMQVGGFSRRNRRNETPRFTSSRYNASPVYEAMTWYNVNDRYSKSRVTTTRWLWLEFSWWQIQTSDDICASCSRCMYSFGEVCLFQAKVGQHVQMPKNKLNCGCCIKSDECEIAESEIWE